MSWLGPAFDKCPGLAEQPGSLGRKSLVADFALGRQSLGAGESQIAGR